MRVHEASDSGRTLPCPLWSAHWRARDAATSYRSIRCVQSLLTECALDSTVRVRTGAWVAADAHSYCRRQPVAVPGVPVLLFLSIGFTCYFWYWHADKYRTITSKKYNTSNDSEWVVLLVCLVALKVGAARLVHSVWNQTQAVAWTAGQDGTWEASGAVVQFAVLPFAATAVDHIADLSAAYQGDIDWPWASLCQSTLQTVFSSGRFSHSWDITWTLEAVASASRCAFSALRCGCRCRVSHVGSLYTTRAIG